MSASTTRALAAVLLLLPALGAQDDHRAEAAAAAARGDLAKAADLYMRLIEAGADDQEALAEGARCLEEVGRYNDALDVLSRGKKKFPEEASFRVGLARVYNRKAADLLQSLGKMDANIVFNFQDSIREAEELLEKWPDDRDGRLILTNALYRIGEWDKARVQAEELVRRFPDHPGGHIVLGDLAFEHYKLLRERAGSDGADTSKEAMEKVTAAREAARASYEKAIELDPSRVVAHKKLGDVFAWNAEVDRAVAKYGDALRLDPTQPISHDWLAQSLEAKDRLAFYEKLGKDYLASAGADPKKAALFAWYAASAAIHAREFETGEQLYAKSVELNGDYASGLYHAMYSAYFYRQDDVAALRYAAAYAARAPIAFADLVRALPDQHRKDVTQLVKFLAKRAMDERLFAPSRDLNHVLAAILDTADAWNNYAFMARESGQYEASEKAYRHALEIEPDSGQLMNDLAVILHYHKRRPEDLEEARKLYEQAIASAKKVLGDGKRKAEEKAVARQTVADASGNLVKLREELKARKKEKKAP